MLTLAEQTQMVGITIARQVNITSMLKKVRKQLKLIPIRW